MKKFETVKKDLKKEFMKRNWNAGMYYDVYKLASDFIYNTFYKNKKKKK